MKETLELYVRWWDGYIENFRNVTEWRAGAYLLWIRLSTGHTKHIPLSQVRWFEPIPNEMPRQDY